jgi:hypothetical protein
MTPEDARDNLIKAAHEFIEHDQRRHFEESGRWPSTVQSIEIDFRQPEPLIRIEREGVKTESFARRPSV